MLPALRAILKKTGNISHTRLFSTCSLLRNEQGETSKNMQRNRKMNDYFIDRQVQKILLKITGFDLDKIFRPMRTQLFPPTYKFVTDAELSELELEARKKAFIKLQMPPVMEVQEPEIEVLAYDPELQGYEDCDLHFIDISPNVPNRERFMTVRETDGTLRTANKTERFNLNQIFFPIEGRSIYMTKHFSSPYLDNLLEEGSYIFVLDSACIQFEPDDQEYHRVTHTTYDHIALKKKFDVLRSTRHFGPMSFYFAWNQKIEPLLLDMIERELIDNAADLIKLLHMLNSDGFVSKGKMSFDIVKEFIDRNFSVHKPHLELAMQTYIESKENSEKTEQEDKISS